MASELEYVIFFVFVYVYIFGCLPDPLNESRATADAYVIVLLEL